MVIFPQEEKVDYDAREISRLKAFYANRWQDPVARIEDIFNVRRADGSLVQLKVPEPQKQMIRDGILGKSRSLVGSGVSYMSVTDKGRQIGASVIVAAEHILIAEDFPNTFIYYVATAAEQATDWMTKMDQLVRDANYWPIQLGGEPILTVDNIEKVFEKRINGTSIVGLSANPSAIRGKTGIAVIFDEAAWAIRFKNQARETWKALRYIIRQGGSARIQSTPRTSDTEEFFWGMYKKGEKGNLAMHSYSLPVISNWKELDLESPLYMELNAERRKLHGLHPLSGEDERELIDKYGVMESFEYRKGQYLRQKCKIPYWWISIQDLEMDRASDLEQFKQENLGIPLDETYKLLKSEWIYGNPNDTDELDDRGDSNNPFYIFVDIAQKRDITAITVVEKIEDVYVERRIEESQDTYPNQRDFIFNLYLRFKPLKVFVDYTGHGIPVCDMLEEKFRNNGANPRIIEKITFTISSKEQMAQGFRNIVMPDPITGKSRYRWLCKKTVIKFCNAVRHCTRVEKIYYANSVSYSGKMHGRDDHFWSKAMVAFVDQGLGAPRAVLGKAKRPTVIGDVLGKSKSFGSRFIEGLNKDRMKVDKQDVIDIEKKNKSMMERVRHVRNLSFAIKCLSKGIAICRTTKKPEHPIHCAYAGNCTDRRCPGFRYVEEVCERYGVEKNEIWKRQRIYKKNN